MPHTLLLRLVGPMQSWGVSSRFTVRETGREPSKSGVVGLLAAALGRPRHAPLNDLTRLRMGVRVDREGRVEMDFHTAKRVYKASGKVQSDQDTVLSRRYYLADAAFLVGLESEDLALLRRLHQALRDPVWPLYLGRKAFVPGAPVWLPDGLRVGQGLREALATYPYLGPGNPTASLRVVLEDPHGEVVRPDVPLSFAPRRFALRRVTVDFIPPPPPRTEEVA